MMQQIIAYLIVAYAAWVVGRRYMPLSLRRGANAWLHAKFTSLGWSRMADRFVASTTAAASCSDGCGSCDGCPPNDTVAQGKEFTVTEFTITPDALRQTIRR
jgi:hypothetical protein